MKKLSIEEQVKEIYNQQKYLTSVWDEKAERMLLRELLDSGKKEMRAMVSFLEPLDFHLAGHQIVFRSIQQLEADEINVITVGYHIKHVQKPKLMSTEFIENLMEGRVIGSEGMVEYLGKIVLNYSITRQLIKLGISLTQIGNDTSEEVELTVARGFKLVGDLQDLIKPKKVKSRTFQELLDADFPELSYLLYPVIRITNQVIIHAEAGVGKTLFANELGYAVATGGWAFGWNAPEKRSVLVVDGEMSLRDVQVRYQDLRERNGGSPDDKFNIMSFSDFEEDINLVQLQWQAIVNQKIEELEVELVIFDNLDSLFKVDQNKQVEWMPAQIWLKRLRQRGIATILVHHSNKQKKAFGTTAVSRNPDLILALNHPDDYNPEEGAVFDVKVDKARELRNAHAATFRCKLTEEGWEVSESPISVSGVKKAIIESLKDGNSHFKDIADDLEKSQSNVKSYLTGLIKDGLVVKLGKGKYELADLPASVPSLNQSNSQR